MAINKLQIYRVLSRYFSKVISVFKNYTHHLISNFIIWRGIEWKNNRRKLFDLVFLFEIDRVPSVILFRYTICPIFLISLLPLIFREKIKFNHWKNIASMNFYSNDAKHAIFFSSPPQFLSLERYRIPRLLKFMNFNSPTLNGRREEEGWGKRNTRGRKFPAVTGREIEKFHFESFVARNFRHISHFMPSNIWNYIFTTIREQSRFPVKIVLK